MKFEVGVVSVGEYVVAFGSWRVGFGFGLVMVVDLCFWFFIVFFVLLFEVGFVMFGFFFRGTLEEGVVM